MKSSLHFSDSGVLSDNNEAIVGKLDELETQIENLRVAAFKLEEQKVQLTKLLTNISETINQSALASGHREEIEANTDRIMLRLLSVNIKVDIPRTADQEQAYSNVKILLTELENKVSSNIDGGKKMITMYLNACSAEQTGPIDSNFQQMILACTADDQRQVRKILHSWNQTFNDIEKRWAEAYHDQILKL